MRYLPRLHSDADVRRWIEAVVLTRCRVLAAVSGDGRVVGFVALAGGRLDHLYVAPNVQGHGVGALLLAAAKAESPRGLRLFVFQRNVRARRFYERHGFSLIEARDGSQNEEGEPDAIYEWRP